MIQSMTGYGRAQGAYKGRVLSVEMKSVNHRHCSVVARLPRFLAPMEEMLKKKVQARFSRGRIDLFVTLNGPSDKARQIEIDLEAAGAYYQVLKKLKSTFKLSGEIDLALLSNYRDIITVSEQEEPASDIEATLVKVLGRAMIALEKMRKSEGKALAADLTMRLRTIAKHLATVKAQEKEVLLSCHLRLQKRVAELSDGIKIDPVRLAQEVAILAERSDITEERTRLDAHLGQFRKMLRGGGGRALEFLLQEMNREINTLSAKSSDLSISMQVVAMKSELEKIREQVLNIE